MKHSAILDEISALLGKDAAHALSAAMGGMEVDIPKQPRGAGHRRFSQLAAVLGEDKALRLCEHYAGERITIGSASLARCARRNQRITLAYYRGESVASLVARFGLGESSIRRIIRRTEIDPAIADSADDEECIEALTLPQDMLRAIDAACTEAGHGERAAWIVDALREKLSAIPT